MTLSNELPFGIAATVVTAGIVGLYVGIVMTIGKFLRMALTELSHRIIYEDLPECDQLLHHCQDIYLARESRQFLLEEELYRELVEIYRSPERILMFTETNKPRFAGKKKKD